MIAEENAQNNVAQKQTGKQKDKYHHTCDSFKRKIR